MIVNTIPFPEDAGEIFNGSPDENTTVKFEIAHEIRVDGLYLEARAREFSVHLDPSKDQVVADVETFELNGMDMGGGGKLILCGQSAKETGRVWTKSQTVPWSVLIGDRETHVRETHVRETIKAMVQNLVAVLVQRAVTIALEKILPSLPSAEKKATDPLHNKPVSENGWTPWPEFPRAEPIDAIKEMRPPDEFLQQYQGSLPQRETEDYMRPEDVGPAARRFMRTVPGKPLFVSDLDEQGRARNFHAAAEAKSDGSFKLPIDKQLEPPACNKSFADCRRHKNEIQFGGKNIPGQPEVPCPFRFGDHQCGVDPAADGESFSAVITGNRKLPGGGFAIEMQRIKDTARDIQAGAQAESFEVDGDKATIEGSELKFRGRVVGVVKSRIHDEIWISITDSEFKKLLPWSDEAKAATDEMVVTRFGEEEVHGASPGCNSCWGSGFYKGVGGPCPEGCKPPRS